MRSFYSKLPIKRSRDVAIEALRKTNIREHLGNWMLKRQSNPRPSDNTVYVIIAICLSLLLVYLNIERKCRGTFEQGHLYGHVTLF